MLHKFNVLPSQLGEKFNALASDFDIPTEKLSNITPLLYQSGYITIKDGNTFLESYTLGIPNREVRIGLMKSLIPYYLTPNTQTASSAIINIAQCLYQNDMEKALQNMCKHSFRLSLIVTTPITKDITNKCFTSFSAYWAIMWM